MRCAWSASTTLDRLDRSTTRPRMAKVAAQRYKIRLSKAVDPVRVLNKRSPLRSNLLTLATSGDTRSVAECHNPRHSRLDDCCAFIAVRTISRWPLDGLRILYPLASFPLRCATQLAPSTRIRHYIENRLSSPSKLWDERLIPLLSWILIERRRTARRLPPN